MSDLSNVRSSRRTLLSAAVLLGGSAALAGSLGAPAFASTTLSPSKLALQKNRSETIYSLYRDADGTDSGHAINVIAVDRGTNIAYTGAWAIGEPGRLVQGMCATDLDRSQEMPDQGYLGRTPESVGIGYPKSLSPHGGKLYIGDDKMQIFEHSMASGVGNASSYRLLKANAAEGLLFAEGKEGYIKYLAPTDNYLAYVFTVETSTADSVGDGAVDQLCVMDLATGSTTVFGGGSEESGRTITGLTAEGDILYAAYSDWKTAVNSDVFAMDMRDPRIRWSTRIRELHLGSPVIVGRHLYVAVPGSIVQLDLATGEEQLWIQHPPFSAWGNMATLVPVPGTTRLALRSGWEFGILSTTTGAYNYLASTLSLTYDPVFDSKGRMWGSSTNNRAMPLWTVAGQADGTPYVAPTTSPFVDVRVGQDFYKEMSWLAATGVSTGWRNADGTRSFKPAASITRNVMAAFLYRLAGSPAFTAPAVSPFADIRVGQDFYKEMCWLAAKGISAGWTVNGKRYYKPDAAVTRDVMAAFLYRLAGFPAFTAPAASPFTDVRVGQDFYKEICWLANIGISTGWVGTNGTRSFKPGSSVTRDQMAAFLYRLNEKAL